MSQLNIMFLSHILESVVWMAGERVKYLLSSVGADYSCILHTIALSACTQGDIRLVDGVSLNEGLVEICFSGTWVSVCDYNWNVNESTVVCRQLTGEQNPSKRLLCSCVTISVCEINHKIYISWSTAVVKKRVVAIKMTTFKFMTTVTYQQCSRANKKHTNVLMYSHLHTFIPNSTYDPI